MRRKIHFIGIGGIGVSALAQWYHAKGWVVSGSDVARSEITAALSKRGIHIHNGKPTLSMLHADRVVYSAAVPGPPPNNAVSYAEAIGELTRQYYTIAVSGSHGKSTTTAMLGHVLVKAGLDPTIIVGTKMNNLGGTNFRMGKSKYFVLEADEYDRSFHNYSPRIAVLTNIDRDHLDTYKTFAGVIEGFRKYVKQLGKVSYIIANWQDNAIRKVVKNTNARVIFYNKYNFQKHPISLPGAHNQLNAEAAWQAAKLLGVKKPVAEKAFRNYKGAWRRLERIKVHNSIVYSDYAHHPTEIKATLAALREKYPRKKIICVFQPHQQDRLNKLFNEFTKAFTGADETYILPLYLVKGREYREGKASQDLVRAIDKPSVHYFPNLNNVKHLVFDKGRGAVIVFMSAGDLDAKVKCATLRV